MKKYQEFRLQPDEHPKFTNEVEWFVYCLIAHHHPHAIINTQCALLQTSIGSTVPDISITFSQHPNTLFLEVTSSCYLGKSLDPKARQLMRGQSFIHEEGKDFYTYLVFYLNNLLSREAIDSSLGVMTSALNQSVDCAYAQKQLCKIAKQQHVPSNLTGLHLDWHQRLHSYLTGEHLDHNTGWNQ